MLVVTDTFDYTDYPLYVRHDEDVISLIAEEGRKPHTEVMEVYDLTKDWEVQLDQRRAWSVPAEEEPDTSQKRAIIALKVLTDQLPLTALEKDELYRLLNGQQYKGKLDRASRLYGYIKLYSHILGAFAGVRSAVRAHHYMCEALREAKE